MSNRISNNDGAQSVASLPPERCETCKHFGVLKGNGGIVRGDLCLAPCDEGHRLAYETTPKSCCELWAAIRIQDNCENETRPIQSSRRKALPAPQDVTSAHSLHRLVRPFHRDDTKAWREREEIRDAIEDLRNAADEAMLCLEAGEELQARLKQASDAILDAEKAIARLWPNAERSNPAPKI